MDGRELRQKLTSLFQKYRYAALVLLVGIFLMLLPNENSREEAAPLPEAPPTVLEEDFAARLASVLSQIDGAGRVEVFLSYAEGEQTLYQTDEDLSSGDVRRETVLITGSDRSQSGLVQQINPPVYRGAIVLCQGADNAAIRLSITQAVANATGLGTNQISVLKMK